MRIPTHIVIDTRDGWTWWRDKDGDPFTETTATTFAELLNGDCKPGHRTYIVAGVTPVLSPELLTAVLRDKDVTAIETAEQWADRQERLERAERDSIVNE